MPVARIITTSPADCEELRRQLISAGYSVKFAAPDEEFSDADIVVAAANVHRDYALQYASEVAAEADADVIVAPGVVRGSVAARREPVAHQILRVQPEVCEEPLQNDASVPAAGVLFGTAEQLKSALSESRDGIRESLGTYTMRIGNAWQVFREKRELDAERKRLDRERREMERAALQRIAQQQRMEAEARIAVERERLRLKRQAEQERLRREQDEMRRAMEGERARIAAERERMAQQPPAPPEAEPVPIAPIPQVPTAVTQRVPLPVRRSLRPAERPVARRAPSRDHRFQRAAFLASIVALLAMIGFAVALNVHPSSPIPHSMVQNPVQEKSPFGAASITPATTTSGPAAKPAAQPVHTAMPQSDKPPAGKPAAAKPSPSRTHHASREYYVAEDDVVVHHYGTSAQKHPPSTQTRAGVRRYSDHE